MKKTTLHRLIIAILALLCYANTLTLHYALDDRMVILESKYTIQGGWESVKGIFTEDTFTGYFLAGIVKGLPIEKTLELASKASAIAVSRPGASPSIPTLDEVKAADLKVK